MNCRQHGRKSSLAFWMLVAVADVAILVATTSVVTMLLIAAGLVALAGGVIAARPLMQRGPEPTRVVLRRRA